ncbi:MAG TPA: hypothetical protein DFR83_08120 [Deltaproteobacteria bacterium]|nr:hypothetical protein [Deltaproteobacteria bacterium]
MNASGGVLVESEKRHCLLSAVVKEFNLCPKTDEHDFEVRTNHSRQFLEEENKVKVTVRGILINSCARPQLCGSVATRAFTL